MLSWNIENCFFNTLNLILLFFFNFSVILYKCLTYNFCPRWILGQLKELKLSFCIKALRAWFFHIIHVLKVRGSYQKAKVITHILFLCSWQHWQHKTKAKLWNSFISMQHKNFMMIDTRTVQSNWWARFSIADIPLVGANFQKRAVLKLLNHWVVSSWKMHWRLCAG